eukprot:7250455-Prymnesium_polylepis.1
MRFTDAYLPSLGACLGGARFFRVRGGTGCHLMRQRCGAYRQLHSPTTTGRYDPHYEASGCYPPRPPRRKRPSLRPLITVALRRSASAQIYTQP